MSYRLGPQYLSVEELQSLLVDEATDCELYNQLLAEYNARTKKKAWDSITLEKSYSSFLVLLLFLLGGVVVVAIITYAFVKKLMGD